MSLDTFTTPAVGPHAVESPRQRLAQRLSQHGTAGLPDSRQAFQCPRTRTALPQLAHQDAVRQEDHVQVAGLPLAVPELTIAHAQMLLAVPMEALGAAPAAPIHAKADESSALIGAYRRLPLTRDGRRASQSDEVASRVKGYT